MKKGKSLLECMMIYLAENKITDEDTLLKVYAEIEGFLNHE